MLETLTLTALMLDTQIITKGDVRGLPRDSVWPSGWREKPTLLDGQHPRLL